MKNKLDVLFVIPGNLSQVYQSFAEEHAIEPPAKARLMAAYLMRRNCSVAVLDANILGMTPEQMAEEVSMADPHLVVLPVYGFNPSSSTHTMPSARVYAQAIKYLANMPILFTGTHPAALPEKTLREEPTNFVCDGEGPITVYELLQAIKSCDFVKKVRSLWYWEDGYVAHNAPAPLLDLNAEPALPGWEHMDPRKYYAHDWHTFYADYKLRSPYANPFSEEGCPFHCDFCNIQSPFRAGESLAAGAQSYRRLKPELFVAEVKYLVQTYGVKYFKIPDEMFMLHPGHVLGIAEGVKRHIIDEIGVEPNFWCYARIDTCRPEFLEPMRAAGVRWIAIGIEAADSKVRSGQDKKFSSEKISDVVARVQAAGIEGALNYIFGLPGDTMESMQATLDLAMELNSPFVNLYCCQALPGAALYRKAKKSGYPLPERNGGPGWIGHSQYAYQSEPFYSGLSLTPAQILKFRDEAHAAYYSRREYREKLLGDPRFGSGAVANIDRMLSRLPLPRELLK